MKKNIDLKEKLYKDNFKKWGLNIRLSTTLFSLITLAIYIFISLGNRVYMESKVTAIRNYIVQNMGSIFIFTLNASMFAILFLGLWNKSGKIILGGKDAKPKYSRVAYYSMLFSAGVAIAMVFYGVYEPAAHHNAPIFNNPGYSTGIKGITIAFFHWSLGPWATYATAGLAMAFLSYNRNLPLAPRSLLYPFIKDKIFGRIGDIFDSITIISSLVGLASSLGLGSIQINSGLGYLFGLQQSTLVQSLIIIFITIIATLSVVSGIKKGVRILSEANMLIAGFLIFSVLLVVPTMLIATNIGKSLILFVKGFAAASFKLNTFDPAFVHGWTVFYWAWWCSWAIFVGVFIAEISKGRSIREYVFATLVLPSIISLIWFGVLGTAGEYAGVVTGNAAHTIFTSPESALFKLISIIYKNKFIIILMNIITVVLIFSFFVTSSDSGSLIVDRLAAAGDKKHSNIQKVFWASLEGLVALSMLIVGGKSILVYLQKTIIILGLPTAIILIISIFGLLISILRYVKNGYK